MVTTVYGDWHRDRVYAAAALRRSKPGPKVHVGDFGLYGDPAGRTYLGAVDTALGGDTMRVVLGNHEQWPLATVGNPALGFTHRDADGFLCTPHYPNLRVCDRVAVWECGGLLWAALAGANSIDYQLRTPGWDWWPEEQPLPEHVDVLEGLVGGRQVDVLVTHDAPASAIAALGLYAARSTTTRLHPAIAYAEGSSRVVDMAVRRLRPRVNVCGHHHTRQTCVVGGTTVHLLGDNRGNHARNSLVVDAAGVGQ